MGQPWGCSGYWSSMQKDWDGLGLAFIGEVSDWAVLEANQCLA